MPPALQLACSPGAAVREYKQHGAANDPDRAPSAERRRLAIATFLALALGACGGPQPLGPTPLDEGVVIYMHSGFRGTSQIIPSDVAKLRDVQGPCGTDEDESSRTWNDCISSVRLFPGWAATLYGDSEYKGATIEVTADIADLGALRGSCDGSYDDCISSIRVYRK